MLFRAARCGFAADDMIDLADQGSVISICHRARQLTLSASLLELRDIATATPRHGRTRRRRMTTPRFTDYA